MDAFFPRYFNNYFFGTSIILNSFCLLFKVNTTQKKIIKSSKYSVYIKLNKEEAVVLRKINLNLKKTPLSHHLSKEK